MDNVLVVDDHPRMRQALASALATLGYCVGTAANGRDALLMLDDFEPVVIVLDLHMPVMDGCEFLRHYRQRTGCRAAILLLSFDAAVEELARDVGADAWLMKGCDPDVLFRAVEALTSRGREDTASP